MGAQERTTHPSSTPFQCSLRGSVRQPHPRPLRVCRARPHLGPEARARLLGGILRLAQILDDGALLGPALAHLGAAQATGMLAVRDIYMQISWTKCQPPC